jgi:hypothetical protein
VKIGLKHKRSKKKKKKKTKKTKKTSKICDSDLLTYEVDAEGRRPGRRRAGRVWEPMSWRAAEGAGLGRRRACGLALGRVASTRLREGLKGFADLDFELLGLGLGTYEKG